MPNDIDTGEAADTGEAEQRRPAPTGTTRDDFHAAERAAFLADGPGADDETTAAAAGEAAPKKPAKVIGAPVEDDDEAEPDPADDDAAAVADDADDDQDDDAAEDDEDDDEPALDEDDEAAAKDPELAKRMAVMRRTEQRQREAMARDRAAFERERGEWKAHSKELTEAKQRFDQLAARAKYDSYSVLRALGVSDEDMLVHAQHLYSRSKDAAVKPEHRAAADRAMRERELSDKLERTQAETAELKARIEAREQQAANDREADIYLRRVVRKVDDASPLTKQLITSNPKKARHALSVTALALAEKLGQLPKAAQVIAAHERKLARELRELGISAPAGAAPAAAQPVGAAGKRKPGAPAPAAKPPAAAPPARVNGAAVMPTRDEIVKELEGLS